MAILNPTRQKLISNVAWLYALQGLNYVLPLAVLPYLVRVLGVERYGLLAFAQAFAQYFVILADYGFNLSATKQIARRRGNRETSPDSSGRCSSSSSCSCCLGVWCSL